MVDMSSIVALAGSLKTAADITSTAMGIRDGAMLQQKVIELQSVILSAQSSALMAQQDQFNLLDEVRTLKRRIESLETWDAQAGDYELKQVDPGAFAYVLKLPEGDQRPNPWLCTNCFESKRKSLLQYKGVNARMSHDYFECPNCKGQVTVGYGARPQGAVG